MNRAIRSPSLSAVMRAVGVGLLLRLAAPEAFAADAVADQSSKVDRVVTRALDWLVAKQSRRGSWAANEGRYPTAMTALAGTAMLMEGSTSTQGRYAEPIRNAVDYLVSRSRTNGLIGDPKTDDRYTYGHGFSMLFLSQVLGEEEDERRREELVRVLEKAVEFSGRAQTPDGGWGYVSAKDGNNFDEGSTTITQVQGLRGCRNAGIPVPREIIEKAIGYIHKCTMADGGVQYSSKGGGGRPAISAAAIACLFNAGEEDDTHVPRMLDYAEKHLGNIANNGFGHWHYAHFYYAQVMYREGGQKWEGYRDQIVKRIIGEAQEDRDGLHWPQGFIGPVYTTASNLTILQLDKGTLPIYQR
ncbi:MAG: terpene cyclase/mutase family protein [Planctomycetes bacterium]|nr:terpene cyclase/mutase family protein [Planctomycetota bacterium]